MKLSIQNWIVSKYNDYKQVRILAKAGFKYVDWDLLRYYPDSNYANESTSDCRIYFSKLRAEFDKHKMKVCQTHSLFPTFMNDNNQLQILTGMENCFLATNILGAKYTVVHPMMPEMWQGEENRQLRIKENIKFFNEITPLARKYHVTICIENMFGDATDEGEFRETSCSRYEDMRAILDGIEDKEVFGFCFDSGHSNIVYGEDIVKEIEALGSEIKVLHLHDNDAKHDQHDLPFDGNIDWDSVMTALKKIGYDGVYNFEIADAKLPKFGVVKYIREIHDKLDKFLLSYE